MRAAGSARSDTLFVVTALPNGLSRSRLAVSASVRMGGAVMRNRARRRARAVFGRLLDAVVPPSDLLVAVRPAAVKAPFSDLERSARRLLAVEEPA